MASLAGERTDTTPTGRPMPRLVSREVHRWQTTCLYDVPSASQPGHAWRVEFVANLAGARAYCDCPAGCHGQRCWHVVLVEGLELGERPSLVPGAGNEDLWGAR